MKVGPATFICFLSLMGFAECAPLTCYSRVLGLSKEIMELLNKVHDYHRTKTCAEILPKLFIDVHNSCLMPRLRDFLYVVENLPTQYCKERPRIVLVKSKVRNLYSIISQVCHRDLVFFTDDCEAIDTGHSVPRYGEDRLQILEER